MVGLGFDNCCYCDAPRTIAIFTKSSRYHLRKSFKQTNHSAYFVYHRTFERCCDKYLRI